MAYHLVRSNFSYNTNATIEFAAEIVDGKGAVKYFHPQAKVKHQNSYRRDFYFFNKNGWHFCVTNSRLGGKPHLAVGYLGEDKRPNVGYARWYFFRGHGTTH